MVRSAVVIGGGITGTLSAFRLAKRGWKVTLLESKHIGSGSSSRSAAAIRQQFGTPETVIGMRYCVDFYKNFKEEVGGTFKAIQQNGYCFLLDNSQLEGAKKRIEMQKRLGLSEVELLSPDEVIQRFPYINHDNIAAATWCPSDGFLHPAVIYNEAADSAKMFGAKIVQNAEVVEAKHDPVNNKLLYVKTRKHTYHADLFIDCTNAWSARLQTVLGATVLPIAPTKRYLWFLKRNMKITESMVSGMPMVVSPKGAYCHPEGSDVLMLGWAHHAEPHMEFDHDDQDTIEQEFKHNHGLENKGIQTWTKLSHYIPCITDFDGLFATTGGYYAVSPDHNPFLGYDVKIPNLMRLVAFSGHGAMFGPFSSLVAAELAEAGHDLPSLEILGHTASLLPFRLGRPFHSNESMVI